MRQQIKPRRARTAAITVASMAVVHLALTYFATSATAAHNFSRGLSTLFFQKPEPDTFLWVLLSQTSAILRWPMEFVAQMDLPIPEPIDQISEPVLTWTAFAINSVLWAGVIYFLFLTLRTGLNKWRSPGISAASVSARQTWNLSSRTVEDY